MASNKVIAGDHKGSYVNFKLNIPAIVLGFNNVIELTSDYVESYELITDEQRKSASSGVGRGLIGGVLLGPLGMLAGGLSAKSKGIYTVSIKFKNGEESLLEVNDSIYKSIVKNCF